MTKEQYGRANRATFMIMMLVMVVSMISLIADIAGHETSQLRIILQGVIIVASAIALLCLFTKGRYERKSGVFMVIVGTVVYVAEMLMQHQPQIYVMAFPMIIAAMLYLSKRMMAFGNVIVVVANTINIVRHMADGSIAAEDLGLEIAIVLICIVASGMVVALLQAFHTEQYDAIRSNAEQMKKDADKMQYVAEKLLGNITTVSGSMNVLSASIDNSNTAMEDIAASTETTAESVQEQAVKCSEIKELINSVSQETQQMIETAGKTTENVTEGVKVADDLLYQADKVKENSTVTVQSTQQLSEKVKDVSEIMETIFSISSQTNLLALNASIEAARAGEAGRGFAVVAEQIRTLSEETQNASNQITDIIKELTEYANDASSNVEETMVSIDKQNELIHTSQKKFHNIAEAVSELTGVIRNVESEIGNIIDSTDMIASNIDQLSGVSEEIAASSSTGLQLSNNAVDEMQKMSDLMEDMKQVASQLKQD